MYDNNGQRIQKKSSSSGDFYLRDHTGRELAVYDTSFTNIKLINLYGADGMIGKVDVSFQYIPHVHPEDGEIYYEVIRSDYKSFYNKDHLGSIRQTIGSNGTVMATYNYSPFGEIISSYVSNGSDKYKFTQKERDTETNLDYFGARYYDSEIGRWLSPDPLADKYPGWSPYNYCMNNPVNLVDPDGREVVIKDEGIRKKHEEFYGQTDKGGNFINSQYRKQFDELNESDIVYNVVNGNLGGINGNTIILGNFATLDGKEVTITLDMNNGATIGQQLSHEFVHGQQFEGGEIWFAKSSTDGIWYSQNMSQNIELNAFKGQQIKEEWYSENNSNSNMENVVKLYPNLSRDSKPPHYGDERRVYRTSSGFLVVPKRK